MRYPIVYADPPWRFENWTSEARAKKGEHWGRANGRSPYDCMDTPDIAALPVKEIAAKDAVLFLWVVFPRLWDAREVIEGWGFTYRALGLLWVKLNPKGRVERQERDIILRGGLKLGLGYWMRQNAEVCLLATRGRPGWMRESKSEESTLLAPVGRHSAKPPEARHRIENLCGRRPRLELFARQRAPGWDAIGLEMDGLDITESLQRVKLGLPLPGVGREVVRGTLSGQQEELLLYLHQRARKGWGLVWEPGAGLPRWNGTDRASASRSLRRLEERGLLERIRPAGRTTHVEFTPAGWEMAQRLTVAEQQEGDG